MRTAAPVPVTQLTDVFSDIERERNWEPSFPLRYIQIEQRTGHKFGGVAEGVTVAGTIATDLSAITSSAASTTTTIGTTNSNGPSGSQPAKNTMVRNINYRASSFEEFKARGIRIARLKESLRERNVQIPKGAHGQTMCLAFHVLGYCNERCNSSADHTQHTDKEDKDLVAWCKANFKLE